MNKVTALALSLFAAANVNAAEPNMNNITENKPSKTAENLTKDAQTKGNGKILIAYYSLSGNTKEVAEAIRSQVGGELFAIETVEAYPAEYRETTALAKKQINEGYKPKLKAQVSDISQYDVVFIGSPNWWGTIAPAVSSFLAENNLNGKTVIPFITHGGGGVQNTVKNLTEQCRGCKVSPEPWVGYSARTMGLSGWLESLGYK